MNGTFSASLDRFLRNSNSRGCDSSEVAKLEKKYAVRLPPDYREFLLRCGNGVDNLWRGSDYRIDMLSDIQEAAEELLSEANLSLPDGAFVFFMHQGYQFFFLTDDGVYFFVEGNAAIEKRYGSFTEFFEETKALL